MLNFEMNFVGAGKYVDNEPIYFLAFVHLLTGIHPPVTGDFEVTPITGLPGIY